MMKIARGQFITDQQLLAIDNDKHLIDVGKMLFNKNDK
jgi:hypothetical protein